MSSIPRMTRAEAVTQAELYAMLDQWFKTTNEQTIGDVANNQGRKPWVWVRVAGQDCRLHADTTRDGVAELLRIWRESRQRLEWHVVPNQRGTVNKIAFGSSKAPIPGVYAYLHEPALAAVKLC